MVNLTRMSTRVFRLFYV